MSWDDLQEREQTEDFIKQRPIGKITPIYINFTHNKRIIGYVFTNVNVAEELFVSTSKNIYSLLGKFSNFKEARFWLIRSYDNKHWKTSKENSFSYLQLPEEAV